MSYRFNNGNGAVTCDICNIIIDEYISYQEYQDYYRKGKIKEEKDLCPDHREKKDAPKEDPKSV